SLHEGIGLDVAASPFTSAVGSIADRDIVRHCMRGVDAVIHTATLHKPHVGTHSRQAFVDTNVTGTLALLEEATRAGCGVFGYTATPRAFGQARRPPAGAPAAWITEDVRPEPRNIYGVTKTAAEDLCELFRRLGGLACLVLRTSRFFPEEDDDASVRRHYDDQHVKVNELLHRRVDLQDVVDAHLLAIERAPALGFGRYIVSPTTPLEPEDLIAVRTDAPAVVARRVPHYAKVYGRRRWRMFPGIDRVYVNERARRELGWRPQ